ncbi:hypothetical protein ACF1GW_38720 [Streptomyces achromogenes]|uniref:hypothetical protein n=1 Tax=Streptomyces achromogenes TaxID=67255 RepID=UPI003702B7B4
MNLDPTRIINAVSSVFLAYGAVGLLSGRMDRWMACGWLAVGGFIAGVNNTANSEFEWAALGAGATAWNAFAWWAGGGEQQLVQLRDRVGRKGGA